MSKSLATLISRRIEGLITSELPPDIEYQVTLLCTHPMAVRLTGSATSAMWYRHVGIGDLRRHVYSVYVAVQDSQYIPNNRIYVYVCQKGKEQSVIKPRRIKIAYSDGDGSPMLMTTEIVYNFALHMLFKRAHRLHKQAVLIEDTASAGSSPKPKNESLDDLIATAKEHCEARNAELPLREKEFQDNLQKITGRISSTEPVTANPPKPRSEYLADAIGWAKRHCWAIDAELSLIEKELGGSLQKTTDDVGSTEPIAAENQTLEPTTTTMNPKDLTAITSPETINVLKPREDIQPAPPNIVFKGGAYSVWMGGVYELLATLPNDVLDDIKQSLLPYSQTQEPSEYKFHYEACVRTIDMHLSERKTCAKLVDDLHPPSVSNPQSESTWTRMKLREPTLTQAMHKTQLKDGKPNDTSPALNRLADQLRVFFHKVRDGMMQPIIRHNDYQIHLLAPGIIVKRKKNGKYVYHKVLSTEKKGVLQAYRFIYDVVSGYISDLNDPRFDGDYAIYARFVMHTEAMRVAPLPYDGQFVTVSGSDEGWTDALLPSSKSRRIDLRNLSEYRIEVLKDIHNSLLCKKP